MGIKHALLHSGVCTENELNDIEINLSISDGTRAREAESCRYFISINSKILCSIKKIKKNGFFDIHLLQETQKRYRLINSFTAPEIIGVYDNDQNYMYLVEEYIETNDTLEDIATRGHTFEEYASKKITEIYEQVFHIDVPEYLVPDVQNEINEWYQACELLSLPSEVTQRTIQMINDNLNDLIWKEAWTTRDIIPRNVLVTNDKVYITDYDLSRITHFFWVDILRHNYYSQCKIDLNMFQTSNGIDERIYKYLFQLSEVYLQNKIVSPGRFIVERGPKRQETLLLADELFQTKFAEMDVLDERPIPPLPINVLQVFWEKDKLFTENESICLPLSSTGEWCFFEIPLPANRRGSFRIDPGNELAVIEIDELQIRQNNKVLDFIKNSFMIRTNNMINLKKGGDGEVVACFCYNDDPQILLSPDLEDEVQTVITIRLRMIFDYQQYIDEYLVGLNNKISTLIFEQMSTNLEKHQIETELHELKMSRDLLNQQIDELKMNRDLLSQQLDDIKSDNNIINQELKQTETELENMRNTVSWKLTKPLRYIRKVLKR